MDKKAFSLAEALITLVVIGVVAAITLPNLINNYRKNQVETKIKTAYSILSNAIKLTELQHGSINDLISHYSSNPIPNVTNTTKFSEELQKNIKYEKICKISVGNQGGTNKCIDELYSKPMKHFNGTNISNKYYKHYILLSNGMLIAIEHATAAPAIVFHADIDGPNKGENTIGKDIFSFSLFRTDVKSYGTYAPSNALYGGFRGYGFGNTWYNQDGGGKDAIKCEGAGWFCTTIIHKNGWKIPDDYPVKKW